MTTVSAAGRGNCPPPGGTSTRQKPPAARGSRKHAPRQAGVGIGDAERGDDPGGGDLCGAGTRGRLWAHEGHQGTPAPAPQALWRWRLEDPGLRCAVGAGAAAARTVGSPVQPRSRLSQHRPRRPDADARPFPGTSFRLPSCAQYAALPDTLKCGKRRGKKSTKPDGDGEHPRGSWGQTARMDRRWPRTCRLRSFGGCTRQRDEEFT